MNFFQIHVLVLGRQVFYQLSSQTPSLKNYFEKKLPRLALNFCLCLPSTQGRLWHPPLCFLSFSHSPCAPRWISSFLSALELCSLWWASLSCFSTFPWGPLGLFYSEYSGPPRHSGPPLICSTFLVIPFIAPSCTMMHLCIVIFFFVCVLMRMKPEALHMLGMCSLEPHPSPVLLVLIKFIIILH